MVVRSTDLEIADKALEIEAASLLLVVAVLPHVGHVRILEDVGVVACHYTARTHAS